MRYYTRLSFLLTLSFLNACEVSHEIAQSHNKEIVTNTQFEKLLQVHSAQLNNTQIPHKKLMILFSGVPGMGKTYIAKQLESHYKAVRICTDDIRIMLNNMNILDKKEREQKLEAYLWYFVQHAQFPNQRIILDASIDRRYIKLFPYFKQHNIPFIVIRLDVPRTLVIDRLKQRDKETVSYFLNALNRWYNDYDDFGKNYTNYFLLNNSTGNSFDCLIKEIDKHIV